MVPRWCIPLAGLALVIGSVAATAPAVAAGHPVRPTIHLIRPGSQGTRPMIEHGSPHINATSSNWSGYAAHGRAFKSVSASWVEPTGHCSGGNKFSSFWVGLDGFSSRTVEQTGSEVDCRGRTPRYFAWYEMFPKSPVNFSNRVRPGDHFSASVTFHAGGHYTLVIKDATQHWSHTIHKTLSSATHNSAEIIAEAPCCTSGGGVLPLANFGTAHFSNAAASGSAIGGSHPTKIVMVDGGGRAKDAVSGLSGGRNFSVTWKRST